MRVIAVCESDGAILTLITFPQRGLRPSVPDLPPRQREVELDVTEIAEDSPEEEIRDRLREIGQRYRVDLAKATLI